MRKEEPKIGEIYLESFSGIVHLWQVQRKHQYELIMDTTKINTGYILTVESHRWGMQRDFETPPKLINILYGVDTQS